MILFICGLCFACRQESLATDVASVVGIRPHLPEFSPRNAEPNNFVRATARSGSSHAFSLGLCLPDGCSGQATAASIHSREGLLRRLVFVVFIQYYNNLSKILRKFRVDPGADVS
jgi:hypothetical protein